MHTISANIHHANLSLIIQSSFKSIHLEFSIISAIIFVVTCAKSLGGPGLNFCEHRGGNSTFGIKNPLSGSSGFGWHNSWLKTAKVIEAFCASKCNYHFDPAHDRCSPDLDDCRAVCRRYRSSIYYHRAKFVQFPTVGSNVVGQVVAIKLQGMQESWTRNVCISFWKFVCISQRGIKTRVRYCKPKDYMLYQLTCVSTMFNFLKCLIQTAHHVNCENKHLYLYISLLNGESYGEKTNVLFWQQTRWINT